MTGLSRTEYETAREVGRAVADRVADDGAVTAESFDPEKFDRHRELHPDAAGMAEADDHKPDADAGDDVYEGTGSPRRLAGTNSSIGLRRQSTVGCSQSRRAGGR